MIGIDHFGASAPGPTIFEHFGFTPGARRRRRPAGRPGRPPRPASRPSTRATSRPAWASASRSGRVRRGRLGGLMRVAFAADHGGAALKDELLARLPADARRAGRADRPGRRRLRSDRRLPGLRRPARAAPSSAASRPRRARLRQRRRRIGRRLQDDRDPGVGLPRHVLGPPGRRARRHERALPRRPDRRPSSWPSRSCGPTSARRSATSRAIAGGSTRSWRSKPPSTDEPPGSRHPPPSEVLDDRTRSGRPLPAGVRLAPAEAEPVDRGRAACPGGVVGRPPVRSRPVAVVERSGRPGRRSPSASAGSTPRTISSSRSRPSKPSARPSARTASRRPWSPGWAAAASPRRCSTRRSGRSRTGSTCTCSIRPIRTPSASIVDDLDPLSTLFIVASKSGTTTEPLAFQADAWARIQAALDARHEHREQPGSLMAAITDPGPSLACDPPPRRPARGLPQPAGHRRPLFGPDLCRPRSRRA